MDYKGLAKLAEIIFEIMVKGIRFQVLQERMKIMDSDQKDIYKFVVGVEQADQIKTKEVYNRVK